MGEILRKDFNMDAATVEGLDRWERIGVLRELSNQACMSGTANVRPPPFPHTFHFCNCLL